MVLIVLLLYLASSVGLLDCHSQESVTLSAYIMT